MLWTVAIILIVLWAVGFVTANTFGGLLHLLLALALIGVIYQLFTGRRAL